MKRGMVDIMVGLFVLLGFAALVFLALRAGNMSSAVGLGETYQVSAKFDDIGGLKTRSAVRSAGVVVGRVVAIDFDPQTYRAEVVMDLDERFRFPRDSSVKILTSGLLGDQYIGIEPGAEERMVEAGGVFARTQSAVVLENIIGQILYSGAAEGGSGK